MSFYDVISERLAALTGSATAVEARDALNEFNVRDIQAVSVSEGGGGGGGSQTLSEVLAAGGDPEGNQVTGALSVAGNAAPGPAHTSADGLIYVGGGDVQVRLDENIGDGTFMAGDTDNTRGLIVNAAGVVQTIPRADILAGPVFEAKTADSTPQVSVYGNGYVFFSNFAARFNPAGHFVITAHSAPADSDLDAGDCAFWFDQTNGAAKLMIKAKSENGTVATGQVTLS